MTDQFYVLCDQIGLYVIAKSGINTSNESMSIKKGGNPSNQPEWNKAYVERNEALYHSTKQHPSIIAYTIAESSANGINLYDSYSTLKQRAKSRPILYFEANGEWNSDKLKFQFLFAKIAILSIANNLLHLKIEQVNLSLFRMAIRHLQCQDPKSVQMPVQGQL